MKAREERWFGKTLMYRYRSIEGLYGDWRPVSSIMLMERLYDLTH